METMITVLLVALATVESSNDPHAIGDNGQAIGLYQIHKSYWKDGCEYLGVEWDYSDAKDPIKSAKVVRAYLTRYGKYYQKKTGNKPTLEVLARIHNGGPSGYKKYATLKYWNKVEKELKTTTRSHGGGGSL